MEASSKRAEHMPLQVLELRRIQQLEILGRLGLELTAIEQARLATVGRILELNDEIRTYYGTTE